MFFAKYDNDGDGIFNIKEESLMMRDIDNDRVDSTVGQQCPLVLIVRIQLLPSTRQTLLFLRWVAT